MPTWIGSRAGGGAVDSSGRALLGIARGVLGELDLEVLLDRLVEAARELSGARYAALGVLDEHVEADVRVGLARFIVAGMDERTRSEIGSLPRGLGVLEELIRDPVALRLEEVSVHPRSYGFPAGHPPMRTFLGVPVFVGGRPFGNLYLTEKAAGEQFTPEDEEAVGTLAELAGVAIENAQRFAEARDRRDELERTVAALEATTQVTRAIGAETDIDVVLDLVAKRGRALVEARVLVIELHQGDELLIAAGAGEIPDGLVGKRMPLSGSFAEQAVRTRSGVRVEDEVSRTRFNEVGVGRLGVQAQAGLVVPLLFQERSYGALLAIDRLKDGPAFSAEDARLLQAFANSAATAVAVAHSVAADIELLAAVVRSSPDAIGTTNMQGVVTSWNPASEQLYGYTAAEMVGRPGAAAAKLIVPEERSKDVDMLPRVLRGEPVKNHETSRVRKDGSHVEISLSIAATHDPYGEVTGVASVARDITEQKRTQRILAQTERLESIGQLAGGVAHDMNNLLTIVLNHTDFALEILAEDDPAGREVHEAHGAAERAATLVRQLLLFARQEATAAETLDPNHIVTGVAGMLARSLGERISLETELTGEQWSIQADRGQLEQVIVNLAVNARDAMPDGGTITITTANVTLAQEQLKTLTGGGGPGGHVCLSVADTGTGMTPEVIAKALDPFYTTKPEGAGTGLGLASVYGILSKTGGHLHITSQPGNGTTIETYWPVAAQQTVPAPTPEVKRLPPTPTGEAILLVEDEPSLRTLAVRILHQHGYLVTTASHPDEARDMARDPSAKIDLLITDIVMPKVTGVELAAQLHAIRPGLPVLYTSGYMPNDNELPTGSRFLAKPFSRQQLLEAVASILHTRQAATG
jgi:two-component system, cell cycle sensor histidine kinase and response regulator CckA